MKSSVDPDQLASLEASWSGSTLFSTKVLEFWKTYVLNALIRLNMVQVFYPNYVYFWEEGKKWSFMRLMEQGGKASNIFKIYISEKYQSVKWLESGSGLTEWSLRVQTVISSWQGSLLASKGLTDITKLKKNGPSDITDWTQIRMDQMLVLILI